MELRDLIPLQGHIRRDSDDSVERRDHQKVTGCS